MGLDMYLSASEKTGEGYDGHEFGYWRKANQIHGWFVKNVQDGIDECQTVEVSREKLKNLKETCEKVVADLTLAENLLPRTQGFFFGNYDYNEWYVEVLLKTIEICDKALKEPEHVKFFYHSSW